MFLSSFLTAPRRVFAGFALYAFALGNLFPRLAEVQVTMGVGEGALGLGLIGAPAGTLIALTFAPPWLERIGFRRVLLVGTPLLSLFYALAVLAPTPGALFLLLVPAGLTIGCLEIILNLEADRVEHAEGRRIMNRAHAFWSIGFFGAGLFGAMMAGAGISPRLHLALVVPLLIGLVVLLMSDFQPAAPRPGNEATSQPKFAAPSMAILGLVGFTLSAMLLEGASIDWSAIYMRDTFETSPFVSGIAVACFAGCHALARFFADGMVERSSPIAVARVQLWILMAGCLAVTFAPAAAVALIGFALMGIGSATMFPLAMTAAAQRTDRPAAVNVAALAQFAFMVFLLAPPILGIVAEFFGIRVSYAVGLPLVVLSLLTLKVLRPPVPATSV